MSTATSALIIELIRIDKNSLLGEVSIQKGGLGVKKKIPQNIGGFMGGRLGKR